MKWVVLSNLLFSVVPSVRSGTVYIVSEQQKTVFAPEQLFTSKTHTKIDFWSKIPIWCKILRRFRICYQKHRNSSESWIIVKKPIFYFRRIFSSHSDQDKWVMWKLISYSSSTGQKYPGNQNWACLQLSKYENMACLCEKECFRNWVFAAPAPVPRGSVTLRSVCEWKSTLRSGDSSGTHFWPFFNVFGWLWLVSIPKWGYETRIRRWFRAESTPASQICFDTNLMRPWALGTLWSQSDLRKKDFSNLWAHVQLA